MRVENEAAYYDGNMGGWQGALAAIGSGVGQIVGSVAPVVAQVRAARDNANLQIAQLRADAARAASDVERARIEAEARAAEMHAQQLALQESRMTRADAPASVLSRALASPTMWLVAGGVALALIVTITRTRRGGARRR